MPEKKISILDHQQIQQKLDRIAYQILEDNFDEQEVIIAGILPHGNFLASRLKDILDSIAPFKSNLMTVELDRKSSCLNAKTDIALDTCTNKVVILVDDVLNSGKTLAYGFGAFMNVPLKKLRTVVLVDRNHKKFPIKTDYSGIALSTVLKEHVTVALSKDGGDDEVYLT